jgi:hypothetical protein
VEGGVVASQGQSLSPIQGGDDGRGIGEGVVGEQVRQERFDEFGPGYTGLVGRGGQRAVAVGEPKGTGRIRVDFDLAGGVGDADLGQGWLDRVGVDGAVEEDVQVQALGGRGDGENVGVGDADVGQGLETGVTTTVEVVGVMGVVVEVQAEPVGRLGPACPDPLGFQVRERVAQEMAGEKGRIQEAVTLGPGLGVAGLRPRDDVVLPFRGEEFQEGGQVSVGAAQEVELLLVGKPSFGQAGLSQYRTAGDGEAD